MSGADTARWRWAGPLGGAVILAALLWHVGTGPLLAGLRAVDLPAVLAALAITAVTTVAAAWRWHVIARGLGVAVPIPAAIRSYYLSQLVNATMPGGIVGDVHRGVRSGRDAGDPVRGLRAVAWERGTGQVVQLVLVLAAVLVLPSPMPVAPLALVAAVIALAGGWCATSSSRWAAAARRDLRDAVLARPAWPQVVLASVVVALGHTLVFVVAARTVGVSAPIAQLLPLAMVVQLATAVPANIGGWGPREGVTVWLFGLAGLGAAQGLATATAYGVLVIVSVLPGLLALTRRRPRPAGPPAATRYQDAIRG